MLEKIPDGCPTKNTFNTCKATAPAGSTDPLTCPTGTFKTLACDCCPVEGKECATEYQGAYCTNNAPDRTKIGLTCPQNANRKDCSLSPCPPNYEATSECECCPTQFEECDFEKYGTYFCDSEGTLLMQNIPNSCPQKQKEIVPCTFERYLS